METFFKTTYLGLSQLLAVPLTSTRPREERSACQIASPFDGTNTKYMKLGFVPFKAPQKLDLFDNYHLKSTSEDMSDSFASECSAEELLPTDKKLNSKLGKNKKGPYRKYTIEEKKLAVEYLNSGQDLRSVAKEFNIPRRNLLRWRKNGCQRKQGGGRPTDSEMQNKVYDMIKGCEITTQREIREAAKQLSSLKNFKASKGWFVKFCRRFGLHNLETRQI